MWEKHLWGSQMLGTDRSRSFQKNLILLPSRSSVLVFQPQIYHIGTTQFFFGPSSGKCLELRRSKTILLATAWTLLFWLWERVSWTLTSQFMLFETNTNVLPSETSFMAWSKKCFSTCWIAYFIILSRHNPYLCIPSTSLKQNTQFQFTKIDIIASSHVWWDKSRQFIGNDLCWIHQAVPLVA